MNNKLIDHYGRIIKSLRVLITKNCNLNCIYCHQEEEYGNPKKEISINTIVKIATAATEVGEKNKILWKRGVMRSDFENIIASLPEYKDISTTTNL